MELDERSINLTLAVSFDRSVEPMAVIELLAKLTLANCLKRSNRAGTDVSLFPSRTRTSRGVVGGMLATMACIALSSSPRLEQSIVRAELPLPPSVG